MQKQDEFQILLSVQLDVKFLMAFLMLNTVLLFTILGFLMWAK